ncbi:MAG: DNA polymerase III subunit delta' [Acidobacteria bacterium]|nr:DNA polymerase III subunit delta' [Acidobacteriota bacterium]
MPLRDIIGHRRIVDLIARSLGTGSLPPSLLFAGPSGVGKYLAAVSIAQALNCAASGDRSYQAPDGPRGAAFPGDACGTCAACVRVARGVHPDVLLVGPGDTGSIKVEQVRGLIEQAAYRPFEGRRRVVIIDEADALVEAAQNALLKILEEPPPSSVFILVTSRPDVLLPTVLSRCPRLRFRHLSAADVAAALMARGWDEARAHAVAAMADGSVGQAMETAADERLDAREVAVRVLASAAVSPDPRRRIECAKELVGKGGSAGPDREQVTVSLQAMASILRDLALLGVQADRGSLANTDIEASLARLDGYRGDRGLRAFAAVDRAITALRDRNAGVKIVADWLVLQL